MVFDMKLGFCPWLLMSILSPPGPPGTVLTFVIAKGCAVDKRNKDARINKNTTLLRDLPLIFASLTQLKGIGFSSLFTMRA
jgi:hypothetical protein